MNKIKCFLIDDESPAIKLLTQHISMIDQLEIIGTSHSAVLAHDFLKSNTVDLLFLDIEMPVLNGIDFIKLLNNPPAIIFTTAYREYALDSYDLDVVDYLLKPIAFNRFLKAVNRYRDRNNAYVVEKTPTTDLRDHIFFNVNKTHHKVILSDILYVESLKDYVRIHTQSDQLVVKGNIGTILKLLPESVFVRIHRSFAVSINHIKSYNQSEVEIDGQKLPIGIRFRDCVERFV